MKNYLKLILLSATIIFVALTGCSTTAAQDANQDSNQDYNQDYNQVAAQELAHQDYYLEDAISLEQFDLPIAYVDVDFYYITDDKELASTTINTRATAEDVFAKWADLNNIRRVRLINSFLESNATTYVDDIVATHVPGDHFILHLALTDNFAAYLEKDNGPLLEEALKNTLYNYIRFDEFHLNLFPAIPEFARFEGTIIEVITGLGPAPVGDEPVQHFLAVLVEGIADENGYAQRMNFDINQDTVLIMGEGTASTWNFEVGMEVIGFYETSLPAPLIYPPHHHARVMVSRALLNDREFPSGAVLVDRFDENLIGNYHYYRIETINEDGNLLYLGNTESEESEEYREGGIIFEDGTVFEGELSDLHNRAMVVLFGMTTRVLEGPNLIGPDKIIILFERAVHPIHHLTDEELAMLETGINVMRPIGELIDPDNWHGGLQLTPQELEAFWSSMFDPEAVQIIVNDVAINAPAPFVCRESGQPMVPVAAIAEALGYNVQGEGADIVVGAGITFTVGVDSYFVGRMAPRQLSGAPVLQDNILFVPLGFFNEILPHVAYIMDGDIVVRAD